MNFASGRGGGRGGLTSTGRGSGESFSRGGIRGGRGGFTTANGQNNPSTENPEGELSQLGFGQGRGRGGMNGGRGRGGGISMATSGQNNQSMDSAPQEVQQTGQDGERGGYSRSGFGGRGRGGGISMATSGQNNQSMDSVPQEVQQTGQDGGRGGYSRGGFGGRGRGGAFSSQISHSASGQPEANSEMSTNARGASSGRGGRGRGGGISMPTSGPNNQSMDSVTQEVQQTGQDGGRGGYSRGGFGGRGRGGTFSSQSNHLASGQPEANSEMSTNARGASSGRGGRGRGGGFGTGANATIMPESSNSNENRTEYQSMRGQNPIDGLPKKAPSTYNPPVTDVFELFKEDQNYSDLYKDIYQGDEDVVVSGPGNHDLRIIDWNELDLDPNLVDNIVNKSKYIRPRKIQGTTLPYIMNGFDLQGHSQTGSGKTAAFMIPIIQKLIPIVRENKELRTKCTPYAIIIEPTRELCLQVYNQGRKLANGTGVNVRKAYGEINIRENIVEIRDADILCATTGRLKDYVGNGRINPNNVKFFVLDEADEMLQGGFLEDVFFITKHQSFPKKEVRQNLLFSATFPVQIQDLATEILRSEAFMISSRKEIAANTLITQEFLEVSHQAKAECLKELLQKEIDQAKEKDPVNPQIRRALVFVETRREADRIAIYLCENNIKAQTINGDREQREREKALTEFRNGTLNVLVATDVCARGIDIKDLEYVINYDLPGEEVTYVHRIGRTGRIKFGYALSFVDKGRDGQFLPKLQQLLINSNQLVPKLLLSGVDEIQKEVKTWSD